MSKLFFLLCLASSLLSFNLLMRLGSSKKCEDLHLVTFLNQAETYRRLPTIVKNIRSLHAKSFCYRMKNQKLTIHVIVSSESERAVKILLETWRLDVDRLNLNVQLYSLADEQKQMLKSLHSAHYSGINTHAKLILTEILPKSVRKVLWFDTDLIITEDLNLIWCEFDVFNWDTVIAAAPNLSDWYEKNEHSSYPALHEGINTGVMLLHLSRMRERDVTRQLLSSASLSQLRYGSPKLADQDFFNAFLVEQPRLLHIISCLWNVQLVPRAGNYLLQRCPQLQTQQPKILHMNYRHKFTALLDPHLQLNMNPTWLSLVNDFRKRYKQFADEDGYELSMSPQQLLEDSTNSEVNVTKKAECARRSYESREMKGHVCYELRSEVTLKRRILPFFMPYEPVNSANFKVTLLTQLSFDRFESFERLASLWQGPISAVVYASDAEVHELADLLQVSTVFVPRRNIGIHIVYKSGTYYPINFLRNVALDMAETEWVFVTDVDFLPSNDLHQVLNGVGYRKKRTCYVVPAFETARVDLAMPENKNELKELLASGNVIHFRENIWPQGHSATRFRQWLNANSSYRVEWSQDFEPYLMLERSLAQEVGFAEDFVGFGWNKVAFVMSLDATESRFEVVPHGFLLHYPHQASPDMLRYRRNPQYKSCINLVKQEFERFLACLHGASALAYLQICQPDSQPPLSIL
ncbi:hypothetical protein Ciccas_000450 [Cichlidogyrus casuarinus]|uniref:Glycosyltransferase-like protein LARGE1 n=1 Tax=Cichlidogyrus casuarinus TaxID=1844966 RepID=A0ABD2QN71_9PLAT